MAPEKTWSDYDPRLIEPKLRALWEDEMARLPIQVDGKLREMQDVGRDSAENEVRQAALNLPRVQQTLSGHELARIIYFPGKILNIVTREL
jgi:leucyl-tRNA synthetase